MNELTVKFLFDRLIDNECNLFIQPLIKVSLSEN